MAKMKLTSLYQFGLLLVLAVCVLTAAACSNDSEPSGTAKVPDRNQQQSEQPTTKEPAPDEMPSQAVNPIYDNKPITIKILHGRTDEVFNRTIKDPIEKKFPNVTVETYPRTGSINQTLDQAIVANDVPDIVHLSLANPTHIFSVGLQYDLSPLIKKYNMDTSRFIPGIMEGIKLMGDQKGIYALPQQATIYGLVYNKDIFDKFAVPYPEGQLTWEEVTELAKQLTREEGGLKYQGLDMQINSQMYTQLGLNPINGDGQAIITTSEWQLAANTYKNIFTIEGNTPISGNKLVPFYSGELAMYATSMISPIDSAPDNPDVRRYFQAIYETYLSALCQHLRAAFRASGTMQ